MSALVLLASAATAFYLRNGTDVGALLQIVVTLLVAIPVFALSTWALRPHGFEEAIDTFTRGLRSRGWTSRGPRNDGSRPPEDSSRR